MNYTCPCCGYRVFAAPPGSGDLCPICGWRDDAMHLRFASFDGLPNGISLIDAQLNYELIGAKDPQALQSVRSPAAGDERDPDWRPIDTDVDDVRLPPVDFDGLVTGAPHELYYWLPRR